MPGLAGAGGGSDAIRAGKAFVEINAQDKGVMKAVDRIKAKFTSFGAGMVKVGLGIAAVGAAALAPLAGVMDTLSEQGKLAATASAFGLTAEEASRLFGIMKSGGSDIRDATEGLVTFNQRISDAMSGTGEEAAKLFADLGMSADSFTGNSADKFYKLLDALRAVPDPAKRVQLLLKAVGEDTGKNLIPLLSMSAEEVRNLGDAFEVSAVDMAAASATTKAHALATAQMEKAWREVAFSVAPAITSILQAILPVIQGVANFAAHNHELIMTLVAVAAGLVGAGLGIAALGTVVMAVGGIITAVTTTISGISAAIAFIATPVGAVIAVLAVLGLAVVAVGAVLTYVLWDEIMVAFNAISAWFTTTFAESIAAFTQMWEGLVAAVKKGDLKLAFAIVVTGIQVVWFDMLLQMKTLFSTFLEWFIDKLVSIPKLIGDTFGKIPGLEEASALLKGLGDQAKLLIDVGDAAITGVLKAELEKAKRELKTLVDFAKQEEKKIAPARVPNANPNAYRTAVAVAGQRGSFNADNARQRFAQGESFERRQEKVQQQIADNTRRGADEAAKLNQNMRLG